MAISCPRFSNDGDVLVKVFSDPPPLFSPLRDLGLTSVFVSSSPDRLLKVFAPEGREVRFP